MVQEVPVQAAVVDAVENQRNLESPRNLIRNQESPEDTDVKSLANPPGTCR